MWVVVGAALADPGMQFPEEIACNQGIGAACAALGRAFLSGEGVVPDKFRAAGLFRQGCELDDAHSCMFLAEAYRTGEGTIADQGRALELYRRSCDLGDGVGCRSVGDLYTMGTTGAVDGRTAGGYYQLGCDLGDPQSCTAAGLAVERGDGTAPDPSKAIALFEKGCEGGHHRGCTMLADRYLRGSDGAMRDLARAYDYYRRGCSSPHDPEACRELGYAQVKGKPPVTLDLTAGILNLDRACYSNDPVGCRYLSEVQLGRNDAEALIAGERGCELGDTKACQRAEKARFRLLQGI